MKAAGGVPRGVTGHAVRRFALRAAASLLLVLGGAAMVRAVRVTPPTWSAKDRALAAFPHGLPLPPGTRIVGAGAGKNLPFRVDGIDPRPPAAASAYFGQVVPVNGWARSAEGAKPGTIVLLHTTAQGRTDFVAHIEIGPDGGGSRVVIEFSPLPLALGAL